MKRIILGGLAVALLAVGAPMAQASASYDITGGCFFDSNSQETVTNGVYVGTIGTQSYTHTKAVAPSPVSTTPVSAVVSCKIQVNGADAPGTTFSYGDVATGLQVGANQISYSAEDGDIVTLCQRVVYAGGAETDPWNCDPADHFQIPPQVVYDTIDSVWIGVIDPLTCGTFASLAGTYGVITIESDGDLIVPDPLGLGLNPVNDCPPYGA